MERNVVYWAWLNGNALRKSFQSEKRLVGFWAKIAWRNGLSPPADLSAMDGYAMQSKDASGPWEIIGESAAGRPFDGSVSSGETIRISTGAFVPSGADCVLIQENTTRDGNRLQLTSDGPIKGNHIRRKGFDFADGDTVLTKGTEIDASHIALAFAAGHTKLPVHSRPTVAILDSGDELSTDPANCAAGQIPASNGIMLDAMIRPYCDDIQRLGPGQR